MKTFLRRLAILRYLRSLQHAVSTEDILNHLAHAGHLDSYDSQTKSMLRLIQRDLNFLLGEKSEEEDDNLSLSQNEKKEHSTFEDFPVYDNDFGLYLEKGQGKSLLWKLSPYENLNYDFERMPAFMALALSISERHLKQVLPSETRAELKKIFEQAHHKLALSEQKLSRHHYQRLTESVEFFQRGQRLHGAEFDPGILDTIYRAILQGKRLNICYKRQQQEKEYDVHPFGVVIMLPKLYLIAKKHEDIDATNNDSYTHFRSFLIHKLVSASISTFNNRVPESFHLREYLDQGNMDVLINPEDRRYYQLQLEIRAGNNSSLLDDLNENPISADQQLTQLNSKTWQLTANVRRTVQLKNWLLALGEHVTLVSPDILKQDLLRQLDAIRSRYATPG